MPEATAPRAPHRVIYVEDDRINIILMEEAFKRLHGWTLQCVETGTQALKLLETTMPDLMMVDMNLPDMTGITLIERMRAEPRLQQVRCVALSADDDHQVVQAARRAGFSDFWLKPLDTRRLKEVLEASLQGR